MNGIGILFLLVNGAALLALPRRWAPLPLLVGACYMTLAQGVVIAGFSFPVLRLLVLFGVIRVIARREYLAGGVNGLDRLMLAWGAWALFASAFHKAPADHLVGQLGLVYNTLGSYFLIRTFCWSSEDFVHLVTMTAFLLVPVALEMVNELLTKRNLFAVLGGVSEAVTIRDGRVRAQGPFQHAILAGSVGGVCMPLMVGLWRQRRLPAAFGFAACLIIVFASNSSGPLMTAVFGVFGLVLWRWRHLTRQMRIAAVVGYLCLNMVMKAPAYYLLARIDLTGSSTGWHRAELIHASIQYLNEWWFAGTDYTRHWMPTGVSWSEDHTDITNHYLQYGVVGGLPLMGLFICALWFGFRYVGQCLRMSAESPLVDQFMIWAMGVGLFVHAATCISVSYFDQSFLFLYLNLAILGSLPAITRSLYLAPESLEDDYVPNPVSGSADIESA